MINLSHSTITGDNGLGHAAKNCRGQPDRVGCNLLMKDCAEKTVANRINNMCLSNLRVDENTVVCRKDVRHLSPWGRGDNILPVNDATAVTDLGQHRRHRTSSHSHGIWCATFKGYKI